VPTPRWWADEMVGRLARYLRFLGHDTEYRRGLKDEEVAAGAVGEGRTLLTRDRALAARVPGALLLRSADLPGQLRELRAAYPTMSVVLSFDRCASCNALLSPWSPPLAGPWPPEVPRSRVEGGLAVFECAPCQRRYWEGSHTATIRRNLAEWLPASAP
jgi:uncharacterized protein with PIN domain